MAKLKKFLKIDVNSGRKYGSIMGVNVDSTTKDRVLKSVLRYLNCHHKFFITTPNPEIIMKARLDTKLRLAINRSDIKIPDTIGVILALEYLKLVSKRTGWGAVRLFLLGLFVGVTYLKRWGSGDTIKVIKGRELFVDLIRLSNNRSLKVFLLGGKKGVSERAVCNLSKKYPKVRFAHASGARLNNDGEPKTTKDVLENKKIIQSINKFKPDMLFVGFGAPKQEKWVYGNFDKLAVGGVMVVGGTFDYVSKSKPYPPKIFDKLALEWLWRLFVERNYKRILTATVIFPWAVYCESVKATKVLR